MSTGSSEQRCGIPAHAFNAKTATTTAGDVLALDGTWYQWRRVFECELVFVRHGISHELLLPTLQLSQFLLSLCGERLVDRCSVSNTYSAWRSLRLNGASGAGGSTPLHVPDATIKAGG